MIGNKVAMRRANDAHIRGRQSRRDGGVDVHSPSPKKEERVKPGSRKDEILHGLERWGLVVSDRQSGKTTALLEHIASLGADSCVIVAMNTHSIGFIEELWKRMFGKVKPPEIVASHNNAIGRGSRKKIFVDEWYYGSYRGQFDGAVTSMPFPVTVIGTAKGDGGL